MAPAAPTESRDVPIRSLTDPRRGIIIVGRDGCRRSRDRWGDARMTRIRVAERFPFGPDPGPRTRRGVGAKQVHRTAPALRSNLARRRRDGPAGGHESRRRRSMIIGTAKGLGLDPGGRDQKRPDRKEDQAPEEIDSHGCELPGRFGATKPFPHTLYHQGDFASRRSA